MRAGGPVCAYFAIDIIKRTIKVKDLKIDVREKVIIITTIINIANKYLEKKYIKSTNLFADNMPYMRVNKLFNNTPVQQNCYILNLMISIIVYSEKWQQSAS